MKKILLLGLLIFAGIQSYCGVKSEIEKKTYVFENDTISQKIEITFIDVNTILFSLEVKNKKKNLTAHISDTAQIKIDELMKSADDNVDIDFDEKVQLPFNVKTYYFEKKCSFISIDVEIETKNRVSIIELEDCVRIYNQCCPFFSIGTMHEVKDKL